MLHFAYGSNMSRAAMRQHAPTAEPIGMAMLADHRFVIVKGGFASVEPLAGGKVFGLLWRLTPRDRVTLDIWEEMARGLYRARTLPVRCDVGCVRALVYVAQARAPSRPKPRYMEMVLAAARDAQLPQAYLASLQRWCAANPVGAYAPRNGTAAWM